ncbi:MAG: SO_0444 family Cu/Zn efflux transporter [bacterium]
MQEFLHNLLLLSLEASPWLLLGLIVGGVIKAWLPENLLERQLGGRGFMPVIKAAIFGAPLPLCSCGVIPVALGLRRGGASKQATVSFLVSTPETGVDSVSVSYALLGPVMAVVRPIAAIASALLAGFLVGKAETETPCSSTADQPCAAKSQKTECADTASSCCGSSQPEEVTACCGSGASTSSCCDSENPTPANSALGKTWEGVRYSFTQLFGDIAGWLIGGLIFAALVQTYLPASFLAQWGSGLPAMMVMAVIGIPMYICATASTPIATGLILAGVSPGTALVFLMAGPATNIATLGVIGKELGRRPLVAYLAGVLITAMTAGQLLDYAVNTMGIDIQAQLSESVSLVPDALAWLSLLILALAAIVQRFRG